MNAQQTLGYILTAVIWTATIITVLMMEGA